MGLCFEYGRGVAASDKEAALWYRRAALAGNPRAQANLAYMYECGRAQAPIWVGQPAMNGVPPPPAFDQELKGANLKEAVKWYRLATAQGDAAAAEALADAMAALEDHQTRHRAQAQAQRGSGGHAGRGDAKAD